MSILNIAGTVRNSTVDGPGIRYVVFVQGCPHHCPGCHNPATHSYFGGTKVDTEDLLDEIRMDPLLSGVTISGGEPMEQAAVLVGFAKRVREMGLHLIVYTGYTIEEINDGPSEKRRELASLANWLIDGRFEQSKRTLELPWRGSENQRIWVDPKDYLRTHVL